MLDPGGDTNRDRPPHSLRAGTAAGSARLLRRPAPASASGAGRHSDELAEDGLARLLDLAPSAALGTGRDRLRLAPRAVATRAGLGMPDSTSRSAPATACSSGTCIRMSRSAPRCGPRDACPRAPPPKNASKMSPKPEKSEENPPSNPPPPAYLPFEAFVNVSWPIRLVLGSLLGVGEGGVGLVDLLEPLLGAGLLADIGVVLPREVSIRLPDLFLVRCPGDPQAFVVISGGHPLCAPTP